MKEKIIALLKKTGISASIDLIEVPKDPSMGDFALPCFILAKQFKKNPVEIAKDIASKIKLGDDFEKIEALGAYVNFFVNRKKTALNVLQRIGKEKSKYGSNNLGKGKKFMIEFSQPNTHKAFHVGHIRGTSLGESLARIKEFCGNKVIRANYSGDTGMHIAKWIWCYTKYHSKEKLKDDESWIAGIYVDAVKRLDDNEDLQEEVDEINRKLDSRSDKKLIDLWQKTRKLSINSWKPIYNDLGANFDVNFFESEFEENGKKIAKTLVEKGIAEISDGAIIMDLKKDNLGVWVLLRKDGTVLYSAKDLALAEIKLQKYKIDESLIITNFEQNLHFQQLRKTLELMKFKHWEKYEHLGYESVRLPEGKMSSRTGTNILYADFRNELVDEASKEIKSRAKVSGKELEKRAIAIAVAAMKYSMIKQDSNKVITFNPKEAIHFEGDTGPYLLYSYARARSILRKVKAKTKVKKIEITDISDVEKRLVSALGKFPEVIVHAYEQLAPNLIANYAFGLAQTFNEFYHASQVIGSEAETFRLKLVESFTQVLKNALHLLGIPVIEEM